MKNNNLYKCLINGLISKADYAKFKIVTKHYKFIFTNKLLSSIIDARYSSNLTNQFIPKLIELSELNHEFSDPIGDIKKSPIKGIVHRYKDRVLLLPHYFCSSYCRFCFRRENIGTNYENLSKTDLIKAISYIKDRPSIREVILSGGDPLFLSYNKLKFIISELNSCNIDFIRIHTRLPIVNPNMINDVLISCLSSRKKLTLILHCNHPDELNSDVLFCIKKLHKAGFDLYSQTVLLKNINDNANTLGALFSKFYKHNIRPYYLHQLDYAKGISHFKVSLSCAQNLLNSLRLNYSSLLIPQLTIDIPEGFGKINVELSKVFKISNNKYLLIDNNNFTHVYEDL